MQFDPVPAVPEQPAVAVPLLALLGREPPVFGAVVKVNVFPTWPALVLVTSSVGGSEMEVMRRFDPHVGEQLTSCPTTKGRA
jgi:hypothetical protein